MPTARSRRQPRPRRINKSSKLARWGHSLGLRIPKEGVERLRLRPGSSVHVEIEDGIITIRPAKVRKKWTEAELLKGVTPDMCGPELITESVGREII